MKKTFLLVTALTALLASCEEEKPVPPPAPEDPEIELSSDSGITISSEGGEFTVSYKIVNPVEGGKISAEAAESWIHDISCNEESVTFTVDPYTHTEERSQTITLTYTYGENKSIEKQITATQNAASYDYNYNFTVFTGLHYDWLGNNDEHAYVTWVSDMAFSDGKTQAGGTYYCLQLFGPAPEDELNLFPAAGTYTLGEKGSTEEMTLSIDGSMAISTDKDGNLIFKLHFSEGRVTVAYEGEDIILEAFLTDTEGKTHHVTYSGAAAYSNEPKRGGVIEDDIDFTATKAVGGYVMDNEKKMEVKIQITDMDVDEEGYVIPPGTILNIVAYMPYDKDGTVATGTYNISQEMTPMTILQGIDNNGTIAQYCEASGNVLTSMLTEGDMEISESNGLYTLEWDFTTQEGIKITGSYTGPFEIAMPGIISTLTGDYTLDLSDSEANATYYGDFYNNNGSQWYVLISSKSGTDTFITEFVGDSHDFESGLPSGKYTVSKSKAYIAPGEFLKGYMWRGYLAGTSCFITDGSGEKMAPAMGGEMNITNNGDGTYVIDFEFVDDRGYTWDGEWSGKFDSMGDRSSKTPRFPYDFQKNIRQSENTGRQFVKVRENVMMKTASANTVSMFR